MDLVEFDHKVRPDKWSKKEILGHLIDSAANNHQRFVRAQFENNPEIFYDQNQWNHFSYYQQMEKIHMINFWKIYNFHLAQLIQHIPADLLTRQCSTDKVNVFTLAFVIQDYVVHAEHHLHQILDYE
jgi:hypothetical protein